jgi:hypothetical protein
VTRRALTRRLIGVGAAAVVAAESEDLLRSADGAPHQDLLACDPARYESRVVGFLRRYL